MNTRNKIKAINKGHLIQLIYREIELNGNECDLNFIDTSDIDSMAGLFYEAQFNGNISNWNTSKVKNMRSMFLSSCFTGDISKWDTSNVENMSCMFYYSDFNGNISKWDTSNVKNMKEMFYRAKFNNDISNWDTGNVKNMYWMFKGSDFNGDISDWDIQNVIEIDDIFHLSKSNNIPYWAKINSYEQRIKAYLAYNSQKEKDLILKNLNENYELIIKSNKDIIKI